MSLARISLAIFFLFGCTSILFAKQCDQPAAQETVRIYFANGMSNDIDEVEKSKKELKEVLGMTNRDFGMSERVRRVRGSHLYT